MRRLTLTLEDIANSHDRQTMRPDRGAVFSRLDLPLDARSNSGIGGCRSSTVRRGLASFTGMRGQELVAAGAGVAN
jgi:hypothetical protein